MPAERVMSATVSTELPLEPKQDSCAVGNGGTWGWTPWTPFRRPSRARRSDRSSILDWHIARASVWGSWPGGRRNAPDSIAVETTPGGPQPALPQHRSARDVEPALSQHRTRLIGSGCHAPVNRRLARRDVRRRFGTLRDASVTPARAPAPAAPPGTPRPPAQRPRHAGRIRGSASSSGCPRGPSTPGPA